MREYIERGALIQKIADKFRNHYSDSCYQFIHDFFRCVMKQINNAPTINPDDLRPQGRWITHDNGTECSECHTLGSPQWKCCPVCTAMMDATDNNVGSKTDRKEPSDD